MPPPLTELLSSARKVKRLNQLELAERLGVSQRHVSFVESGRSRPSRELLLQWLDALQMPLEQRNSVFTSAGFAPPYPHRGLEDTALQLAQEALTRLLSRHDPYPALLFDASWNVLHFNRGGHWLATLLFPWAASLPVGQSFNMLDALIHPEGMAAAMTNLKDVGPTILARLREETTFQPSLAAKVDAFEQLLRAHWGGRRFTQAPQTNDRSPMLSTRFRTPLGELSFFSLYTTFGMPQDITLSSLRLEYLFPADDTTRHVLEKQLNDCEKSP
jgi:transcriptional regulator with XRE-family HTH domain